MASRFAFNCIQKQLDREILFGIRNYICIFRKAWSFQRHIVTSDKLQCHLVKSFNILFCNSHRAATVELCAQRLKGKKEQIQLQRCFLVPTGFREDFFCLTKQRCCLQIIKIPLQLPGTTAYKTYSHKVQAPYEGNLLMKETCLFSKGQTQ